MTRKRLIFWTLAALIAANEVRGIILVATIGPAILRPMFHEIRERVGG